MRDDFSDDVEYEHQDTIPPIPPVTFSPFSNPAIGFPLIILGVLFLAANGFLETRSLPSQPWYEAVWSPDGEAIWDDAIPVSSRHISMDHFPQLSKNLEYNRANIKEKKKEEFEEQLFHMGVEKTERVAFFDVPWDELEPMIVSGRMPEPGGPEVLAGVYARLETFHLDDVTFEVVGRLAPATSGFHLAYILPYAPEFESLFSVEEDATQGWLAIDGRERMKSRDPKKDLLKDQEILGAQVPTTVSHAYGTIIGLLLVALGGAIVHMGIFRVLARRVRGITTLACQAIIIQPSVVLWMHLVMYGTFFSMMIVGINFPVPHLWLQSYIAHEFAEGGLSYVGEAYASGNIFDAAVATWFNNYIIQTVGFTFIVSLVIPMVGVLKNLLSFALVGFGMAPLWTGIAGRFSFHSITMTLELEAYIFACIIVVYFWRGIVEGVKSKDVLHQVKHGFRVLNSGVMLTGMMLGMAALYEAVTLILLH